jgi:hypothetical protein
MGWIAAVLALDAVPLPALVEVPRQVLLGAVTWGLLAVLLRREPALVRAQTLAVVVLATAVEYTFSPLLQAYVYRIGTVPLFVPPGHGLVYLAALALGRSAPLRAVPRTAVTATVVVGGAWAGYGLLYAPRPDALGAFWYCCLLAFLVWGRSRLLYVGAFIVVSYLELLGTRWGTWAWAVRDPVLGVVSQGNPPSGAAGGYGWFDLYAMMLGPRLVRAAQRLGSQRLGSRRAAVGGRGSAGQGAQHLVVQLPVGGHGAAAEGTVHPVE